MKAHCLGFGCSLREHCIHHFDPSLNDWPVARICVPLRDGFSETHPIRLVRPAGLWGVGQVKTPQARTHRKEHPHG